MSYDSIERSREDGRPIHLYRFTLGTTVWRYTSADEDLIFGSETYKAVPIKDDGVRQSGEAVTDAFTIMASSRIGPAQVYMSTPPGDPIVVERLAVHEGLTVPVVNYTGGISQINFPTPGQCTITTQTLNMTLNRKGVRLGWQRTCPYALYDAMTCKVEKTTFRVSATVESIEGFNVTSSSFRLLPPAMTTPVTQNHFIGGFLEWTVPGMGTQRIFIENHSGDVITVFGDPSLLYVGAQVFAYRGCQRTRAACQSFDNYQNYGGFEWMPGRSPFDATAPMF